MRKPVRDFLTLDYKGLEIPVRLDMYNDVDKHGLVFSYNGANVQEYFDADKSWWEVGRFHCQLIDRLGVEKYKLYVDTLDEIEKIEKDFVVVDNQVYNYYHDSINAGQKTYHSIMIQMEDGKTLDGSPFNTFYDNEKYNKVKTLENLKRRVSNYYKKNDVKPSKKYLLDDKSKAYQDMKKVLGSIG